MDIIGTILSEAADLVSDTKIWGAVFLFSLFGTLLGLINYFAGKKGLPMIQERFPSLGPEKFEQVDVYYEKWGARMLVLSGLPLMNTLVCLGAGMHNVKVVPFLFWSIVGLLVRNWILLLFLYIVLRRIF